jgi:LysR family transcriptional regulator, nod-box dependent transcriptional activator
LNLSRLDLNLLVVLDALLAEQSVTRAADRLCLSPSATSGALARLREFFEDELLVQVGRKMALTPLGQTLAKTVPECLLHVRATVEARPEFDPINAKRKFTLMMSDYVSDVLMPQALQRLEKEAPGVTIDLMPNLDAPWEALDRGEVDFLILPQYLVQDGHPSEVLFEDTYVAAVWSENPHVGGELSLEQFQRLGHIAVRFGRRGVTAFDAWLTKQNIARQVEIVAMSFNCVPRLLIGTNRVATMHRRLAEIYADSLPMRLVPLPFQAPSLFEVIQWHKYRDRDPGRIWLQNLLKECAG